MRDFSWRYFTLTGDIDAYLLYKTHRDVVVSESDDESAAADDGEQSMK